MSDRKIFVIDTSVLLYDRNCIFNLKNNDIYIPMVVLEELDRFKNREGILGENSRYFNRFLDEIRSEGSLSKGIYPSGLKDNKTFIKVVAKQCWEGIDTLDKTNSDNIILSNANYVKKNQSRDGNDSLKKVIIVTKDINLRVKADAASLEANDYYADYSFIKNKQNNDGIFKGYKEIHVDSGVINSLYGQKSLSMSTLVKSTDIDPLSISQNEFVVLKSIDNTSGSALCAKRGNALELIKTKSELYSKLGIEAKNKEQQFALNLLENDSIPLVTLTGVPGSGKTYLTLMSALKKIEREQKNRIIFTRPIQTVGKDIGFLPGTLNEKMSPWLAPIVDNFRNQFGDLTYFDIMMEKGTIDIAPLSYIRGRSFNDAVIIVDEAQNATVHELKTVITRTGKNSKIVLLGDIEQVDLPYIDKDSNGLTIIIEKLKNEIVTGHVNFEKGYRSELANIAAKLL